MATPRTGHGRRRAWRWGKRIGLGLLAFVVLAVIGFVLVLHTDWGREVAREQIEARLNETFVGGASIGRLEGSPLDKLVLHDVVINGPDGKPAITAKRLELHLALLPLISKQARVAGVIAEDVEVDLRRDERGELQITKLIRPGPESGWSIDIPDLEVKRAHVRFDTGTEVMNFDDLAVSGALHMPRGEPLEANVTLSGSWRERDAAFTLAASVRSDDEVVSIPSLRARVGEVTIAGDGLRIVKPLAPGYVERNGGFVYETRTRPMQIEGTIAVTAPEGAIAQLVPGAQIPADLQLTMIATRVPSAGDQHAPTDLRITGTIDGEPVGALIRADLATQDAKGVLWTGPLDLEELTRGAVEGRGRLLTVFDVARGEHYPVGTAIVHAAGDLAGVPSASALIAVTLANQRATTSMMLAGDGVTARGDARLRIEDDEITLERGHLVARTANPSRATGGLAPVHGAVELDLSASGTLSPGLDLAVTGRGAARNLRLRDLSVGSVKLAIDARHLPSRPLGRAELVARDVERRGVFLRELDLTAANREDGTIQVTMRSRPRQDPWLVEADALVTPGEVWTIDLQRHRVRAGSGGEWSGTTGRVAIAPQRIVLRNFASSSDAARLEIDGSYQRRGRRAGDLVAKIDVDGFTLDNLREGFAGTLDASVELARTNGRFAGIASARARGVALAPEAVAIDLDVTASAGPDKLAIDAKAWSSRLGTANLVIDIDAPKDITELAAWRRLHREAIRMGRLELEDLEVARLAELAGVTGEYAGRIDGDLQISPAAIGGAVRVRDLVAPSLRSVGPVDAALAISQTGADELTPTLTARVDRVGTLDARATFEIPDHLFDVRAWQQLGRGAIKGGSVRADNIAIDPALLDHFGITTTVRARASVVAEVTEAVRSAKLAVQLRELRGSPIEAPLAIDATAAIDDEATVATVSVSTRSRPVSEIAKASAIVLRPPVTLLEIEGRIPLTIRELERDPRAALATPLELTATLPNVPAPQLLGIFGRTEIVGGEVTGTIEVRGTVGKPTLRARLAGTDLRVPPGPRDRPRRLVKRLAVKADWDGTSGRLEIDGIQDDGMLHVLARGSPEALAAATAEIEARNFDLASLLAFVPGPVGAATGTLDANLSVTGLDPKIAKLAGELHLDDARIPIAPHVGMLRRTNVDVVVRENELKIDLAGRLRGGTVKVDATLAMDGASPTGGEAKLTLRDVSPIGALEPEIDADVTATLRRGDAWIADITVRNAVVRVPSDRGEPLDPVGAPPDMVFTTGERITRRPTEGAPPERPAIIARVVLDSTYIESEAVRGYVKGKLEISSDGDAVGIVGQIEADRGSLDLFGRRYQLERAAVRFDGSTDPVLDIRITHEFPEITTITTVRGRLSDPLLVMTSDPATYSEGQLLGFLLGGEPSGQPIGARDQAAAAGASLVANMIGGYVKDALPLDLDVLRYEAATELSGAAITVGTWITRELFIAYRRRIEAQPDENSGEGQIEYWLTRRIVAEGIIGDSGYNSVDLLWRKRY